MKKVIAIIVLIISVFSFAISYNRFDIDEIDSINDIGINIGKEFYIPDSSKLSDAEKVYNVLYKTAKHMNLNIFRDSISTNKYDELEITKYVLIISDTKFYDVFSIDGNTIKDNETNKDDFLSTKNKNEKNQIGTIYDFANNHNINIKPLESLYKNLSISGTYYVETNSSKVYDEFINKLINNINDEFDTEYSVKDFVNFDLNQSIYNQEVDYYLKLASKLVLLFCLILLIYSVINNAKRISIYKLHGVNNIKIIWILEVKYMTMIFFIITLFISMISSILNLPFSFILVIIFNQLLYYVLFIVVVFITYNWVVRNNITSNLKNNTKDKVLIFFYTFLKFIVTIYIILSIISTLNYKNDLNSKLSMLENWEKSKNYGVFNLYSIGEDGDVNESFIDASKNLYSVLNKQGALFVDTSMYEEQFIEINKENINVVSPQTMMVNPNYLNEFPIYDSLNNKIEISEDERDWVVLVPDIYEEKESNIKDTFKELRRLSFEYEINEFSGDVSEDRLNQDIKIIWTKSNQEIFSFNPEVYKENDNNIKNPIIEVITESNSIASDRQGILGRGNRDPMKIRLLDNDSYKTYNSILPILKELKLDDNLKYFISSNELILNEISRLNTDVKLSQITIIILTICFLVIALQNTMIIFKSYKNKFIIRSIYGFGFIRQYKELILAFIFIWCIQIIILGIRNIVSWEQFIVICALFIIFEITISIATLLEIENKSKVKTLKGEHEIW